MKIRQIVTEPLFGFLAIGVGLFGLFALVSPDEEAPGSRVIVVDREALLEFIQFRSRAFEPGFAADSLEGLTSAELEALIADYVREEALYREALALGMDANDYIIKQRMIQKVEFISDGFATAAVDLSDSDVAAFYEANKADYFIDPYVTFTHVFFDSERHGRDEARALAVAKLDELNRDHVPFSDSTRHGDRFLYHVNYVERNLDFVASHFGESMARDIFALEPSETLWQGPFESPYGFHLVLLTTNEQGRYPELDEIAGRVRDDARRDYIRRQSEAAMQAIVDTYDVRIDYAPAAGASARRDSDPGTFRASAPSGQSDARGPAH